MEEVVHKPKIAKISNDFNKIAVIDILKNSSHGD